MSSIKKHNENATVALVRSAAETAEQITDAEVREMVREAVKLAGGLSNTVKDGQFVVIKPNLISSRTLLGGITSVMKMYMTDPYKESMQIPEKVNGLTVDWRVTKAMVELIREINPSGKVYVMECSGEGCVSETFKALGYTHENIPGIDKFMGLDETGDEFRAVDSKDLETVDLGDKQLYNNLLKYLNNKYYFDKVYYNADVIISIACLKNHMNAGITGTVKNVGIGAMPGKIYGTTKNNINRAMTIDHAWEPINNFIHDFYMARPVDFALTDGLQGLAYGPQGQGAKTYEECKMNMRLLLASKDPIANDTIHAYIVGVDAEKLKCLKDLSHDGFGTNDSSRITVVGNARVDEVKKQYPFSNGFLAKMYKEPPKTRYSDYNVPELSIEDVSVVDNVLSVKLKSDRKTTKIELHIDGKLAETFNEGFDQLQVSLKDELPIGSHDVSIYTYDRYLNCGNATASFKQ